MKNNKFITMAIESSCDETSVAILREERKILSNVIASQIHIHKAFGGVVPEIASRHHLESINLVTKRALEEADIRPEELDLIGATYGPGLIGALLIGLATAKGFALSLNKPLVGVHHIQGHISAAYIAYRDLRPPFLALVVSGGHTSIVEVTDYYQCQTLGQTRDDAVGEAYDKVARVLGLGYPGGPEIDQIAKGGDPKAVNFKRVFLEKDSLDFSFSGTKTGVLNHINTEKQAGRKINVADIAASFQQAVLDVIVKKTISAAVFAKKDKIALVGGVAANSKLRAMMTQACCQYGLALYVPPPILCTDNAAMIACAAYHKYKAGFTDDLSLDAIANLPL